MRACSADLYVNDSLSAHDVGATLGVLQFEGGVVCQGVVDGLGQFFALTIRVNNQLAGGIDKTKLDIHVVHLP